MDPYYIELAREALGKALRDIERAEEYLIRGKDDGFHCAKLHKIRTSIHNRSNDILHDRR